MHAQTRPQVSVASVAGDVASALSPLTLEHDDDDDDDDDGDDDDGDDELEIKVTEVECKIGNKLFVLPITEET